MINLNGSIILTVQLNVKKLLKNFYNTWLTLVSLYVTLYGKTYLNALANSLKTAFERCLVSFRILLNTV